MYNLYEVYGFKTKLKILNDYLTRYETEDQKEVFEKMPSIDTLIVPILPETRELWLYSSMESMDDLYITCKLVHVDEDDFTIGVYDNDYKNIHFITADCANYFITDDKQFEYNMENECKYYYKEYANSI